MSENRSSSIETSILYLVRWILSSLPLYVMGLASLLLRRCISQKLKSESHYLNFESKGPDVDVISLSRSVIECNDSDKDNIERVIIYLHGGAFTVCDSADILLSERLLPLLGAKLGVKCPSIYSIRYNIFPRTFPPIPSFEGVQDQILKSYISIASYPNRQIVAVMGDSAGGNLALGLMLQLKKMNFLTDGREPRIILISPWLNIVSTKFDSNNLSKDFLVPQWLKRSSFKYLGDQTALRVTTQLANAHSAALSQQFVGLFKTCGVKVVVFDMDQCAVRTHSHGRLKRHDLISYIGGVMEDFISIVKALSKDNTIHLAIATHSDEIEYNKSFRSKTNNIIGVELARAVVDAVFPPEIAKKFYIVAYNPAGMHAFVSYNLFWIIIYLCILKFSS